MSREVSRRQFVKSATLLSAAPLFIPSRVFAKPAPSDRVALGHIGVGGRGTSLLKSFLQLPHSTSVAVCDCFASRREDRKALIEDHYAQDRSGTYKGCEVYADYRELLDRRDIDAVIIATPDHWHVPIAIEAVKKGKDVYVEKPLGLSIRENLLMRQAVQRYGRIFQYGTQQRSDRDFRFACELVRNGYVGKLDTVYTWCAAIESQADEFHAPGGCMQPVYPPDELDYDMWLGPAVYSPYTRDRCTPHGTYHHYDNSLGFIAGWGAHPLDIAQWGNDTDDTAPVYYEGTGTIAQGLFRTVATWDFWCEYANGVRMRFMDRHKALPMISPKFPQARDHGTLFQGDKGWVAVDRTSAYASPESLLRVKLRPGDVHLYKSTNHYGNFIDCILSRRQAISPVNAAVQSDIISHLCDISVRLGRPIRWDPESETILDDVQASTMMIRAKRNPWEL